MTRTANARVAGFTFLFYIAAGLTDMYLSGQATAGPDTAARLASIARHATQVRITVLLGLLEVFSALVLGVTLYAITREEDQDLAMLGLICRAAEGITGAFLAGSLGALWLASGAAQGASNGGTEVLGAFLLRMGRWSPAALFFAVGSTAFSWLLLRGRMIPLVMAWIGVIASVVLVTVLPLQIAGFVSGLLSQLIWLPMLAFEVPLGLWLLVKGVRPPLRQREMPLAR
jgi:hypothetical protein